MKMTKRDKYLVAKLGEEAAELSAACSKLLARTTEKRVGRVHDEFADVLGVGRLLKLIDDPCIHGASLDRTDRERKRAPKA
jgi:hypothetical protein